MRLAWAGWLWMDLPTPTEIGELISTICIHSIRNLFALTVMVLRMEWTLISSRIMFGDLSDTSTVSRHLCVGSGLGLLTQELRQLASDLPGMRVNRMDDH